MFFRNFTFVLSALLVVTITTVFVLSLTVFGELKEQRVQTSSLLAAVNQRVGVVSNAANDFLNNTSKDMLLLQSLLGDEKSGASWSETGLRKFMEHNSSYEELFLFGGSGECLFRAVRRPSIASLPCGVVADIIQESEATAGRLSEGELYASPLVRYAGLLSLIYGMPLKDGRTIVAAVSAEDMMEDVRRLARADELVFLVDREGFYLAHPNRLKEKFIGATDNFYLDFPEAPVNVLEDEEAHNLDTEHALFSFWRVRPFESNFALYQGTRSIKEGAMNKEQWILVAVSTKPN